MLAALSISGPMDRLKPRIMRSLIPSVIATANAISLAMGVRVDGSVPRS